MNLCPCGSGSGFDDCCRPVVTGESPAQTAEALMRSRFTAFVRGERDHIERSWAPEKRGDFRTSDSPSVDWVSLEVLDTVGGGETDDTGIVEFAARYRTDGGFAVHRERSNFRRDGGNWVYVDGDIRAEPTPAGKPGRNAPCPCGSGKKFKKCCGV